MLTYVPVTFGVYRPLKAHLRWTLQNLVGFADHAGKCFPSLRTLAAVTGIPKSTVGRHLTELVKCGAISRKRRPGGGYIYQIDARFLPASRVSHARKSAVPQGVRLEEKTEKKKAGFADSQNFEGGTPWKQRIAGWKKSGFWLPVWGPKPNEHGCLAPIS
jgi:DNA-binding transcriptional regulator YhcF (GntR family)